jgi:hypothetical protein
VSKNERVAAIKQGRMRECGGISKNESVGRGHGASVVQESTKGSQIRKKERR